jgi:hypothetical protein
MAKQLNEEKKETPKKGTLKEIIPLEHKHDWKGKFQGAWRGVKKVTFSTVQKTEMISQTTKHKVKRSLLLRNRNKLYQELGDLTFHLLEEKKIQHEDLIRSFERIQGINKTIEEEENELEQLKVQREHPQED